MGRAKRTVFVKAPRDPELREKLLERLLDAVQSQLARYRFRGDGIEIQLVGDPVSLKRSMERIRRAREEFYEEEQLESGGTGVTIINKSMMARHLGVPLSLEALQWALSSLGIDYWVEEEYLFINEEPGRLRELASRLYELLSASRQIARGKAAEVIAVASLVLDEDVSLVAEIGLQAGVLRRDEEGIVLASEKTNALKTIINRGQPD